MTENSFQTSRTGSLRLDIYQKEAFMVEMCELEKQLLTFFFFFSF